MKYQRLNLFGIRNLAELSCPYRLLKITGLPDGEHFDRDVHLLAKNLSYQLQAPIAIVHRDDDHFVAIPADIPLPELRQPLRPHVVSLVPRENENWLNFDALNPETLPVAISFLQYAFRMSLMHNARLWGRASTFFWKKPVNYREENRQVDVFGGFYHKVVPWDDGQRLFLALDLTYKYIDPLFLTERARGRDLRQWRWRHCLYLFGHQWYQVQLLNPTGQKIRDQAFLHEQTNEIHNVYEYTRQKCQPPWPDYISELDPDSPAILYGYPGNEKERYGAAALCRLIYRTEDPRVRAIHARYSARPPDNRFREIKKNIDRYFEQVTLGDIPVEIDPEPLRLPRRVFPVPDQRFGRDTVLHVQQDSQDEGIPITALGDTRLRYLLSKEVGPLAISHFNAQYVLLPLTLPREIGERFSKAFCQSMEQLIGRSYQAQRIWYDDRDAPSLLRQVQAVEGTVERVGINRGYALLVLPTQADEDLHNALKSRFWPDLQFQCARASKIMSFYTQVEAKPGDGAPYEIKKARQGEFTFYTRNTALGMLIVNRKWLWGLETPLHYEVYVGIDVLNQMAGFTFILGHGRYCYFYNCPSQQKEKLPRSQIRTVLYDKLREHLLELGLRPKSIVVHRDGRSYKAERAGIRDAIERLKAEGLVDPNATMGVADIRKSSASHLRLVEEWRNGSLTNPRIGSYQPLSSSAGIVCNTGWPFQIPGTANPLHVYIVEGDLNVEWILEDIFALSQLNYSAPDKCVRDPLTIKLNDEFLEPIAGEYDEDRARYGERGEVED